MSSKSLKTDRCTAEPDATNKHAHEQQKPSHFNQASIMVTPLHANELLIYKLRYPEPMHMVMAKIFAMLGFCALVSILSETFMGGVLLLTCQYDSRLCTAPSRYTRE